MPTIAKVQKNQKLTPTMWEDILMFYVDNPLRHAQAAQRFGVSKRSLTKWYYEGAPSIGKGPMKDVIGTVEVRARAMRARAKEDEIRAAEVEMQKIVEECEDPDLANSVIDAATARAHEGHMISAARRNLIGMHTMLGRIIAGINKRGIDIEKELQSPEAMTPKQVIAVVMQLGKLVSEVQTATKTTMEMERLLMGSPSEIIGLGGKKMSPEKAHQILALANKTFIRLQQESKVALPPVDIDPDAGAPDLPEPSADDPDEEVVETEGEPVDPEPAEEDNSHDGHGAGDADVLDPDT